METRKRKSSKVTHVRKRPDKQRSLTVETMTPEMKRIEEGNLENLVGAIEFTIRELNRLFPLLKEEIRWMQKRRDLERRS